jgi:hypothetical protein
MLITVMVMIAIAAPSVNIMVLYAFTDHMSSRDIVGTNEVDKSNGTDIIMGNMSNGD